MTIHRVNENSGCNKSPIWMSGRTLPSEKLSELRIETWDMRTRNEVGKLENLKKKMKKLNLNIIEVSKVIWPDENDF